MSYPFNSSPHGPPPPRATLWNIMPQSARTWLVRTAFGFAGVIALASLFKWLGLGS